MSYAKSLVLANVARIAAETDAAFLATNSAACKNFETCEGCEGCVDDTPWIAKSIGRIVENKKAGAIIEIPRWLARKNGFEVIN